MSRKELVTDGTRARTKLDWKIVYKEGKRKKEPRALLIPPFYTKGLNRSKCQIY